MKKIYGIGVGPGDKDLITLKAVKLLQEATYIFVPNNKGTTVAGDIAGEYLEGKRIISLDFPMGKDNVDFYPKGAELINTHLADGETGVFLTLGDPMVYSTFIYLMFELRKLEIEVETIPGITSFTAAANALQIPITIKDESFYLCDHEFQEEILNFVDSICILKTTKDKEKILAKLEKYNFKYWYIKRCTHNEQQIIENKAEILADQDYLSLIFAKRNK